MIVSRTYIYIVATIFHSSVINKFVSEHLENSSYHSLEA